MTYEDLVCLLIEYCLNNVPISYNSIINTVKLSKEMEIDFDTINWDIEDDSYCIYFSNNNDNIVFLHNIYRIDIEGKDTDKSTTIVLSMLNEKEYKILFISKRITSCYGISCKNINKFITKDS